MRVASLYAAGAVMGWSAADVDAASIWQFWAAWNGYVNANTPKEGAKLTEAQKDDLFDWLEASDEITVKRTMTYGWDGLRVVPRKAVEWA